MDIYSKARTAIRTSVIPIMTEFFPNETTQNNGVIFSHLNGPEDSGPYMTINILSIEQKGHHSTSTLLNEDDELAISNFYEVLVQFSFFGSTAGNMAHHFSNKVSNNPVAFLEQQRNKLGYMRKSALRRVPQKRDTQWIEMLTLDVTYNYIVNEMQLLDPVEGVVIADETGDIPVIIKIPETIVYP